MEGLAVLRLTPLWNLESVIWNRFFHSLSGHQFPRSERHRRMHEDPACMLSGRRLVARPQRPPAPSFSRLERVRGRWRTRRAFRLAVRLGQTPTSPHILKQLAGAPAVNRIRDETRWTSSSRWLIRRPTPHEIVKKSNVRSITKNKKVQNKF